MAIKKGLIERIRWRMAIAADYLGGRWREEYGTYELWEAPDGSQDSLFMPSHCSKQQYELLTTALGAADDGSEDTPMVLVRRYWAPSWAVAKLMVKRRRGR